MDHRFDKEMQYGVAMWHRLRFLIAVVLLSVLGVLMPRPTNAQPFVNQSWFPDTFPVCANVPDDHVVIVVRQSRWPAWEQPVRSSALPTRWLANQPATPWRPTTAGVNSTLNRYQGYELTVRELIGQIPTATGSGWTNSYLNISSPARGLWLLDRDLLTTWTWTGSSNVQLVNIYHQYGANVASNFIITGTVANNYGDYFDESVGFVCVTSNQFVTQPSQWGSDTNYYQRVEISNPSDLVLYRDWCGRWTCLNRPRN